MAERVGEYVGVGSQGDGTVEGRYCSKYCYSPRFAKTKVKSTVVRVGPLLSSLVVAGEPRRTLETGRKTYNPRLRNTTGNIRKQQSRMPSLSFNWPRKYTTSSGISTSTARAKRNAADDTLVRVN